MRVAELSWRSGVRVPTIKFYLREGLLPQGDLTSPNQATYGKHHLHRLLLIRALIDLAQVPVAQVRAVLAALDSDASLHSKIGAAHRAALPARRLNSTDADRVAAAEEVRTLIERRDWVVGPDAPAITTLVDTIAAMRSLGHDRQLDYLDAYADAVERIAELEVGGVIEGRDPDQIAEKVVIGTILGETLIAAMRLLAQESIAGRDWPAR